MADGTTGERSGREEEASLTTPPRGSGTRAPDREVAEATKQQPGIGGQPRPLLGEVDDTAAGDDGDDDHEHER